MCGQLCSRLCAEGRDCAASATKGGPRARGAHDGGGTETLPSTARLLGGGLARSIRGTSDHQGWGWGGEAGRAGDEGPPQRQTPPPQPHRCARAQTQGAGNEPRNVAPCNATRLTQDWGATSMGHLPDGSPDSTSLPKSQTLNTGALQRARSAAALLQEIFSPLLLPISNTNKKYLLL